MADNILRALVVFGFLMAVVFAIDWGLMSPASEMGPLELSSASGMGPP